MADSDAAPSRAAAGAAGAARHGIAVPRGQAAAGAQGGRFTRMFGHLPVRDPGAAVTEKLIKILRIDAAGPNFNVPAGYTYLGQFIDHDITFDPTSKLQRDNDPHAIVNFRTPRFDLDSLYGSGPRVQPFLYDWPKTGPQGVKLLVGRNPDDGVSATVDLPRNDQGRALIGDARNDENLIVSQLHLLFVSFHNKVVDWLLCDDPPLADDELFDEAQRLVRWHYQWIVVHDFLERIVDGKVLRSILRTGTDGTPPTVERRFYHRQDEPAIPVEFSAAAYRFGHSMVRSTYFVKDADPPLDIPIFPTTDDPEGHNAHLGGFRRLPADLQIDWDLFFFALSDPPDRTSNFAMKIDTSIVEPLFRLPPKGDLLPALNLRRGRALGLPCGQDVAHAMGLQALTDTQMDLGAIIDVTARTALLEATPLWFYILREAQVAGATDDPDRSRRLGPLGSRIVAEVLVGLLEADPQSYLRQWPTWKPTLPCREQDFTMLDLLAFVRDRDPCATKRALGG